MELHAFRSTSRFACILGLLRTRTSGTGRGGTIFYPHSLFLDAGFLADPLMVSIVFIDGCNQYSRKGDHPFGGTIIDACLYPIVRWQVWYRLLLLPLSLVSVDAVSF